MTIREHFPLSPPLAQASGGRGGFSAFSHQCPGTQSFSKTMEVNFQGEIISKGLNSTPQSDSGFLVEKLTLDSTDTASFPFLTKGQFVWGIPL